MKPIELSVILPCHNEGAILEKNTKEIMGLLNKEGINYEIMIVEDGSTDNTGGIGERLAANYSQIYFFHADKKLGRGLAVTNGILKAHGSVVGFIDVDLQTPAEYITKCYHEIKKGADVVETIRYCREDESFFIIRMILTASYRSIFKKIFQLDLEDTLAGCKFFNKKKILPVLKKVKDHHWFWDTELMVLAYYEGLKIKEIPSVFLSNKEITRKSKVSLISTTFDLARNLFKLKSRVKQEYLKPGSLRK